MAGGQHCRGDLSAVIVWGEGQAVEEDRGFGVALKRGGDLRYGDRPEGVNEADARVLLREGLLEAISPGSQRRSAEGDHLEAEAS